MSKKRRDNRPSARAVMLAKYGLPPNSKFEPKYIKEGQQLATIGVSQRSMAWYWKISEDSITRWKEQVPELAESLKRGEADRNVRLLSAMFDSAIVRRVPSMMIFLAKNWLGMRDVIDSNQTFESPIRIEIKPPDPVEKK